MEKIDVDQKQTSQRYSEGPSRKRTKGNATENLASNLREKQIKKQGKRNVDPQIPKHRERTRIPAES